MSGMSGNPRPPWYHDDGGDGDRHGPDGGAGPSFTIGTSRGDPSSSSSSPRPVPPPSAAFGRPLQPARDQDGRGRTSYRQDPRRSNQSHREPMIGLPNKLYECEGVMVIYQPRLECGIVKMTGQKSVYCFFASNQIYGSLQPSRGAQVCVNARLVETGAKVPYLAASVWDKHERVGPSVMDELIAPAVPEHLEMHYKFSEDLAFELENLESTPTPDDPRKRFLSPDTNHGLQHDNKRMRSADRDQTPLAAPNLEEEWGENGVTGIVERFLNDKTGEITVRVTRPVKVLFHAGQVWTGGDGGEMYSPFLETYPSTELPFVLVVGQEVRLNARRVNGSKYDFQATVVWVGDEIAPVNYRTEELVKNLNLSLGQHNYLETGDPKYQLNPLLGTPDFAVPAEVVEYLSHEAGILRLNQGSKACVLFHLNQVWTGGDNAAPLGLVINRLLSQCLPVGAKVMVNMRPISNSQGSKLKYQATCLWPFLSDGHQSDQLLPQYIERYMPYEERVNLVEELDSHHDKIKKILKLHLSPFSEDFLPVQAVLMGLPNFWQAQVVAGVNDDFGIIRITSKRGGELTAGVRSLLVMFHIEDVFDAGGLPAIQSSNVSMSSILDSYVDLTARPICYDSEPESILDLQQRLAKEDRSGRIPLLQAVYVCIKKDLDSPSIISNVPKPTPFRSHPGNFSMGTTQFYLNPILKLKLNLKLVQYFGIVGSQPPYKTKLKEIPNETDQMNLVKEIRKIDENNTQRFLYGQFPDHLEPVAQDVTNTLPKIVDRVPVKLLYLHQNKLSADSGIIQVNLKPGRSNKLRDSVSTLAYFKLARYRFFMKKDCFAEDLANIMPVNSTENYFANIELSFPGSKVPYIVLDIWNENLRQDLGSHSPVSDSLNDNREYIEDCARNIAAVTSMSFEILMRSNKRETMTRSRDGVKRSIDESAGDEGQRDKSRRKDEDEERSSHDRRDRDDDRREGDGRRNQRQDMFSDLSQDQMSSPRDNRVDSVRSKPRICTMNFNPHNIPDKAVNSAKYFIIKSAGVEDVIASIQYGLWTSNDQGNRKLNHGYREQRGQGPVYLLFSVMGSKHFCGMAEMVSFVDFKARSNVWWSQKRKWRGNFKVKWIYVKDVPNAKLNHIKLENNENKPITFTRDCHDVPQEQAIEALNIIRDYKHETTVLDDSDKVEEVIDRAEGGGEKKRNELLPKPVRSNQRVDSKLVWNDFLYDHFGQVIKIMDESYGIAAGFTMYWGEGKKREFVPFQVLFDTFDVFLDDFDCNELGKSLKDVLAVGDLVRFHAVRLESAKDGAHRDIRHLSTGLIAAKTPEKLKAMKFPKDLDQVVSLEQIMPEKIENFMKVAGIMNDIKVRKSEQKLLDEIKEGVLASKVMKLPVVSDKILQESDDEDASKKNSLAERDVFKSHEAKIKERLQKKSEGKGDGKGKDAKKKKEEKVDYKNLDKLVEELKPKELRKVIMSYVSSISNLPEEPDKRKVNVAAAIASVNSEKDLSFFEDFFISLGQNCLKAEKGIKVGHVFVTQVQVKTIRGKGVLSKKDIENGPVPEKKEETIVKPSDNTGKKKETKSKADDVPKKEDSGDNNRKNQINNTKKDSIQDSVEEIVLLDDDDEDTSNAEQIDQSSVGEKSLAEALVAEIVEEASKNTSEEMESSQASTDDVVSSKTSTVEDETSKVNVEGAKIPTEKVVELTEKSADKVDNQEKESVLQKYSSNEIRLFLKNFMKLIDSNSSLTISDVSSECKLSEPETRRMASEVTEKCAQSPVVDGKRQSFKLQNIFINSNMAEKIAKFNYQ